MFSKESVTHLNCLSYDLTLRKCVQAADSTEVASDQSSPFVRILVTKCVTKAALIKARHRSQAGKLASVALQTADFCLEAGWGELELGRTQLSTGTL